MEEISVLEKAVITYGKDAQVEMLLEEMSEVSMAIQKMKRRTLFAPLDHVDLSSCENIHEELADLSIMLSQMELIFDKEKISRYRAFKIARLEQRLATDGKA